MRLIFILVFTFIFTLAKGQLNNTMFDQRAIVQPNDSNSLLLNLRTLGFVKNNEYFGDIADGYTLFGYQINPSLSYLPGKKVRIDLGVYAQKDFGNDDYSDIQPTFTLNYKTGDAKLIFGTLEGATSHQLIEPLYDFENVLIDRLENGIQFNVINDWIFFDTWVNWQNMIYPGDDDQEDLTGGISMRYVLVDKTVRVSIPFQTVINHLGGQIDASDLPLQTYATSAVGLTLDFLRPDNSLINNIRLDSYYTHYNDFSSTQLRPFDNGSGWYVNAEVKSKTGLEFMVSYWRGNDFLSIDGGQIYPSESSSFKNAGVLEPERELLIFRLFYNKEIAKNLMLSARFEPFLDLLNNRFEFSNGLYLNYNVDFYLLKNKLKGR